MLQPSFSHKDLLSKDLSYNGLNLYEKNDSLVKIKINSDFCDNTQIEKATDNNDTHDNKKDNIDNEDHDGIENCDNVSTISLDSNNSAVVTHDNADYGNINSMGDDNNDDDYVHVSHNNNDVYIHIERDNNNDEYVDVDCEINDISYVDIIRNDNDNFEEDDIDEVDDEEEDDDDHHHHPYFDINHDLVVNLPLLPKKSIKVLDQLLSILGISVKNHLSYEATFITNMKYAFKKGIKINEIKGISPLISLPLFNIRRGVAVETMHAVFLGVVQLHNTILMTSTKEPYYIGDPNSLEVIDYYLLMIKPPSRRSRKPRSIKTYLQWKASE